MAVFASEVDEWAAACRGDSSAFAIVYERHRDRVYRLAVRMSENRHDAEDITAAAFFELWRRRTSVRIVGGSALPWLLVTVANSAKNHARSVRRYRTLIDAIPRGVDDGAAAFDAVDTAVDHARLMCEVRALPDRDRALLVLTAVEGYSVVAAAEAVGLSPGAARVRLHRMRGKLRDAYTLAHPRSTVAEEGGAS